MRYLLFFVMTILSSLGWADGATSPTLRGVTLGLYAWDPQFDYGFALEEIADTGANAVSLTVTYLQENAKSTEIKAVPHRTIPRNELRKVIQRAHAVGLEVMLFPIVTLVESGGDDWRGSLKPSDPGKWWENYEALIVDFAKLAQEEKVEWLSVGSEFSSLESDTNSWKRLIGDARDVYDGKLLYSANWDHFDGPELWWDELDAMGISSYYELTSDPNASAAELRKSWGEWRDWILSEKAKIGASIPLVFTEVGYPSIDGGAVYPWDYTMESPVDLGEQALAYQAFIETWWNDANVQGVFFYKWLDFDEDIWRGYSPRGKPAEAVLRQAFNSTPNPDLP